MNIRDLFRRKPDLSLINLTDYETELLRQKEHKTARRPPPPIPSRGDRPWTDAEMAAMRENRHLANQIYHRIKGE